MRKLYVGGKFGNKLGNWALVDDEDYDRCANRNWSCSNGRSICARINGKTTNLARFILKNYESEAIDHINSNQWDNQKNNLRGVTSSQNSINRKSQYKPFYNKEKMLWQACIEINGKARTIGLYETCEEAIKAHDKVAKLYLSGEL